MRQASEVKRKTSQFLDHPPPIAVHRLKNKQTNKQRQYKQINKNKNKQTKKTNTNK